MSIELNEALDLLHRTPASLRALLSGVGAAWHDATEGPDTWSPREVVGHLIHADETIWLPRASMLREHGPTRTFEPADRIGQRQSFEGWELDRLLERFTVSRRASLAMLEGWDLAPGDLDRQGRHPDFGIVTFGQLLAAWTVHDLAHLGQIGRTMAKRYRDEVGPWRQYLGILDR